MYELMKKHLTRILSLALVLMCCLTAVMPVNAASSAKLKIKYKGETISVGSPVKNVSYSKVKKAWGKADKTTKKSSYYTYTYKKGKSTIKVKVLRKNKKVDSVSCRIKDKNVKINGVYVGMKRSEAVKLLKKSFGKSSFLACDDDSCIVTFGKQGIMTVWFDKGKVESFDDITTKGLS